MFTTPYVSRVTCQVSFVTCHMSHVMCHMTSLLPNCQSQGPNILGFKGKNYYYFSKKRIFLNSSFYLLLAIQKDLVYEEDFHSKRCYVCVSVCVSIYLFTNLNSFEFSESHSLHTILEKELMQISDLTLPDKGGKQNLDIACILYLNTMQQASYLVCFQNPELR